MTETSIWGALASIILASLTYFAGRRVKSGRIDTSEAAELWEEGRSIRKDLTQQIEALRQERASKDAEHARALSDLREQYERELAELRLALQQKADENARLTLRVNELELEIDRVKAREARVAQALSDKEGAL